MEPEWNVCIEEHDAQMLGLTDTEENRHSIADVKDQDSAV